jgi:NAD(P)-dependent dehydrogenase (short-subunit alcohol dehydrogenase family)
LTADAARSRRLKDRVALVIGAGSSGPGWGNGKAAAVLFAREGARVFAVDVDPEAAAATTSIIREEGGIAESYEADVTDGAAVERLVSGCIGAFGRIDVLHNNVGVIALGGPVDLSEAEWDRVHAVNLKSFFLTAKHVLPQMERQGAGSIVNVSSVASIRWTGISYVAYSSSKAAVNQLTQAIAVEYAPKGIRCNAVLPGLMDTPMVQSELAEVYPDEVERMRAERNARCPTGKMGDAWDVARASLFLASDEARYITGHCLVVDGGLSCISA